MPTGKKHVEFAICVENEGYDDLEVWKVYQVLPDARAAGVGCIRVIDESGGLPLPGGSVRGCGIPRDCPVAPTEMAAKKRC